MLCRLALTLVTAAALTAAGAPVARADIGFLVMPGFSGAEIDGDAQASRLDLVRGGAVIASSADGAVSVDALEAGDVARAYNDDGTPAGSVTYDGTPAIADACVGGTSFTATRGAGAMVQYAGAFTNSAPEPLAGTWDAAQTARVTLSGPLSGGDTVFVSIGRDDVEPAYTSTRIQPAVVCTGRPGATPSPRPTTPGRASGKLRLSAARRALAKARLRGKLSVPVTLPEAGRIELRVILKGRTVARGSRTGKQGATRVALKLSKRLEHGARVVLRATFRPSRTGAKPQRAKVHVTLTGPSSSPGAAEPWQTRR